MKVQLVVAAILGLGFGGCGVTLKDKSKEQVLEAGASELIVESDSVYELKLETNSLYQQIVKYDRLVLKSGASFVTQGSNVTLEINELVSEDGTIATFKEGSVAAVGAAGRHGGKIEILVGRATGKLHVELRGENGGAGAPGKAPDSNLRGAAGYPGDKPYGVNEEGGYQRFVDGTVGDVGGPGQTGYPGQSGFAGGNSGSAVVQIAEGSNFAIEFAKFAGLGGAPGAGGAGGEGGDGGLGGYMANGKERMPNGARGPQGAQGPAGQTGAQGTLEPACLKSTAGTLNCQ